MDIFKCFPTRSERRGIRAFLTGGVEITGCSGSVSGDGLARLRARSVGIAGGKPNGREAKTDDNEKRWTVSRQNIRRMRIKLNAAI